MYYPIMLNLKNKKTVIIGGGNVAFRKANQLIKSNANIIIVSPKLNSKFESISKHFKYINDTYKKEYIKDSFLVIGATSSRAINENISKHCKELNILSNIVDSKEDSDFITPAVVSNDGLLISVSSNGGFPTLSKYIKKDLDHRYKKFNKDYMNLLKNLRELVLNKYYDDRIEIFNTALNLEYDDLKKLYTNLLN